MKRKLILSSLTFLLLKSVSASNLITLQQAYPNFIRATSGQYVIWTDGTMMLADDGKHNKTAQEKLDNPSLLDQVENISYKAGIPAAISKFNPPDDPGRIRYEAFFRKMYGNSKEEVSTKLTTIYWMPRIFGARYPLQVTTVNSVDKKLFAVSCELELLVSTHLDFIPYLDHPGGTFNWRVIAKTNRLSPHSFGMTIDINAELSNYWQWDLEKLGIPVTEEAELTYRNTVPWEIVPIFEKYGFIWGGKWHHYDTMHFEYRPELIK